MCIYDHKRKKYWCMTEEKLKCKAEQQLWSVMSKISIGQKYKVGIGESGKWGRQRWNCEGFTNVNIWMLKMACWIRCISLRKEASILQGRCKYALIRTWAGINKTPPVEVETDLRDSGILWRFSEIFLGFLRERWSGSDGIFVLKLWVL